MLKKNNCIVFILILILVFGFLVPELSQAVNDKGTVSVVSLSSISPLPADTVRNFSEIVAASASAQNTVLFTLFITVVLAAFVLASRYEYVFRKLIFIPGAFRYKTTTERESDA